MRLSRMNGRRMLEALLATVALGLVLCACGVSAGTGGTDTAAGGGSGAVSYDAAAGQIVAQLFPRPGFVFPPYNGAPEWTLYGDGTLVYASGGGPGLAPGSSTLMAAKLTPDQVEQVLGVAVTQHHVFAATKGIYGRIMPDVGTTLLIVNADGKHAQVNLSGSAGQNPDTQTQDVFAIEQYFLSYKPANPQPYTVPGVAVLALSVPPGATDGPAPVAWPYADVDLSQAQARECPLVNAGSGCSARMDGAPGVLTLSGQRAQNLLAQFGRERMMTQNGQTYRVLLWPLLPDATQAGSGGAPAMRVVTSSGVASWPLYSA